MNLSIEELARLYYRYKRNSEEDIRNSLKRIKLVIWKNGLYYPLSEKSMNDIIQKPRGFSLTFDCVETSETPMPDLKTLKQIKFLVKSTSRFFLKPDVGEIFDAIEYHDLRCEKLKAICMNSCYETIPGTDGEHFIMTATLLEYYYGN